MQRCFLKKDEIWSSPDYCPVIHLSLGLSKGKLTRSKIIPKAKRSPNRSNMAQEDGGKDKDINPEIKDLKQKFRHGPRIRVVRKS